MQIKQANFENHVPRTGADLTKQEYEAYIEQGFFTRLAVFSSAEVVRLKQAVEQVADHAAAAIEQGHTYYLDGKRFVDTPVGAATDRSHYTVQFEHKTGSQDIRVIEPVHILHPVLDELIDDERLAAPMRGLLGQHALSLWTAKLNLKRAHGSGFGWHQDSPYWIHDCDHVDDLPNVMLALDEQHTDNGCFEVISGSHKQGVLPGTADGSQLGGFFTDRSQFTEQQRVKLTGPAGSLFFFSPHSVHGSAPNHSPHPRRALIYTYQPGQHPMLKVDDTRRVRSSSTSAHTSQE